MTPLQLKADGHNILRPNHMSLTRACRSLEQGKPFLGRTESEYTNVILESAEAVSDIREEVGIRPFHRLTLLRPGLILSEPALYRGSYNRVKPVGAFEEKVVARTLRLFQTQKGLCSEIDEELLEEIKKSPTAQSIISIRQSELDTHTFGLGLHAAQTCAAVIRLSPGVNHVFSALSSYARNIRSAKYEARMKARRLFGSIQDGLSNAVGAERTAFIEREPGPIKIISDAPVEWLPIRGLPLSLRYDCSRINATPGNLMMSLLPEPVTLVFEPNMLQKILVLSS